MLVVRHMIFFRGVCVLVKKYSRLTIQQVSVVPEHHGLEIVAVDLSDSVGTLPFRLVVACRSPSFDSTDPDIVILTETCFPH